jgi:Spherulation-specific family 4
MTVVINPDGGPGYYDSNYAYWISELKSAGIVVVGYVPTEYGAIAVSTAEYDAQQYAQLYGLSGIFVDQMSNIPGWEWYYSDLTSYAHSIGEWLVIGNPGTSVPASFLGTVDVIVVWENTYAPSQSWMQGSTFGDNPAGFGELAYSVSWDPSLLSLYSEYASYLYITNLTWPYPYADVPSYFDSMVATIASFSSSSGPSPSSGSSGGSSSYSGSPTYTINVWTDDVYYNFLFGMYTIVYYNGNVVATGFSPMYYTGPAGSYTVCVENYGYYTFSNWGDGTTSSCCSLSLSSNVQLDAYFNT